MLNTSQSVAIVVAIVAASAGFLWLLHRIWPSEQRRQHNDLIGWQVTVIGTTYAVIVAFMLYAVWTNFEAANVYAEAEANSLINVVRAAQGLPAAQKRTIEELAREYVDNMLTQEWPAMNSVRFSPTSFRIVQDLWAAATNAETHNTSEQTSLDHTLTELSDMSNHRRLRQLQATSGLPGILWAVLVVGAIVTIVSACLFGSNDFKLHQIQVFMLSLILSLALVAIADIDRPFQGSVHVDPSGFERARSTLINMNGGR
ncbi:MAG: DUF4239 domain-containing protein [Acidobacteriaceae bacterium]|nr:DUF4239 domain-containing protein [Acidobacteriaceae bacterium]